MTLSSQDSRKLFNGAEGIRWSLRRSNVTRMSAQDMFHIGPGAAPACRVEREMTLALEEMSLRGMRCLP